MLLKKLYSKIDPKLLNARSFFDRELGFRESSVTRRIQTRDDRVVPQDLAQIYRDVADVHYVFASPIRSMLLHRVQHPYDESGLKLTYDSRVNRGISVRALRGSAVLCVSRENISGGMTVMRSLSSNQGQDVYRLELSPGELLILDDSSDLYEVTPISRIDCDFPAQRDVIVFNAK